MGADKNSFQPIRLFSQINSKASESDLAKIT